MNEIYGEAISFEDAERRFNAVKKHYGLIDAELDILTELNDIYEFTWDDLVKVIAALPKTYQETITPQRLRDTLTWIDRVEAAPPTWRRNDLRKLLNEYRVQINKLLISFEGK